MKVAMFTAFGCAFALVSGCVTDLEAHATRELGTHYVSDAMKGFLEEGVMPGGISILWKDGVQETCCMGYADVAAKRPITVDDPFMQCSQTKGFCGVTVAKLVEQGKLSLEDPISKYLPEFREMYVRLPETNGVRRAVRARNVLTVGMCLNHTSGFPFELPNYIEMGGWNHRMPLRSVAATASALPLEFEPGTGDLYTNVGIDIAAAVVEVVTGLPWEEYLRREVLEPLDMKHTTFYPTDEMLSRKIELYDVDARNGGRRGIYMYENEMSQRPYNGPSVFPSAGAGLWTTARDQVKFYKMLLNLGVGENGVRILREETVRNLLAKSTRDSRFEGYSLGFHAPVVDGDDQWFGHGGAYATNCMVNWHRRELYLWVTQNGKEDSNYWYPKWQEAMARFFKSVVDMSGAESYTVRTK